MNNLKFLDKDGNSKTLADFPAKAYLIVNVASKCGLTPQYEQLEALYKEYHGQGLEILAFPANEFAGQEPGTNEEIQEFCSLNYGVTFPVNQKIVVKGEGQHPLYKKLTGDKPNSVKEEGSQLESKLKEKGLLSGEPEDIKWNFEKFLLDAKGKIVERYFPDVSPTSPLIQNKIKELLQS